MITTMTHTLYVDYDSTLSYQDECYVLDKVCDKAEEMGLDVSTDVHLHRIEAESEDPVKLERFAFFVRQLINSTDGLGEEV